MELKSLILNSRSIRRFDENARVTHDQLLQLIDMARFIPSAQNAQPLRYFLSFKSKFNDLIFPHLAWAGFLEKWAGPAPGERPDAYIVVLGNPAFSSSLEFCA